MLYGLSQVKGSDACLLDVKTGRVGIFTNGTLTGLTFDSHKYGVWKPVNIVSVISRGPKESAVLIDDEVFIVNKSALDVSKDVRKAVFIDKILVIRKVIDGFNINGYVLVFLRNNDLKGLKSLWSSEISHII